MKKKYTYHIFRLTIFLLFKTISVFSQTIVFESSESQTDTTNEIINFVETREYIDSNFKQASAPNPPIISANKIILCATGESALLAASGCNGTITWNNGATTTLITVTTSGTFSAICSDETGTSTSSNSIIITKGFTPTKPILSSNKPSICDSETAILTATGCNGIIKWSTGQSAMSDISVNSSGTYTAVCINICGMSNVSNSITIIRRQSPSPPIISSTKYSLCNGETTTLSATGCNGTIQWNIGRTTTSIMISIAGTYSATCSNSCGVSRESNRITITTGSAPSHPTITVDKTIMCDGERATLTASGCSGQVNWNTGAITTIIQTTSSGTYGATCINNCGESRISNIISLRAGVSPTTPRIALTSPILCGETSKILIASGCNGFLNWSNGATTSSIQIISSGTYGAVCESICGASPLGNKINVQFLTNPVATVTNTGPYEIGQKIELTASGGVSYLWRGVDDFLSTSSNVSILNASLNQSGIYTVTVINSSGCTATATTNVVVNPCTQKLKYDYMKAGNDLQYLFSLSDEMTIKASTINTGIIVTPICGLDTSTIQSVRIQLTGPPNYYNQDRIENVYPYSAFGNSGFNIVGSVFPIGEYTLTVTGYSQNNLQGITMFGPETIHFTIIDNLTAILLEQPNIDEICAGNSFDINFGSSGTFPSNNTFEAQISDADGLFSNPIKIGEANVAGIVTCQLPTNLPKGEKYQIRVISTNPIQLSNSNLIPLKINARIQTLQSPNDDIFALNHKTATEKIVATNKIFGGGNTIYQAGRAVIMLPGFVVDAGSIFKTKIEGCN